VAVLDLVVFGGAEPNCKVPLALSPVYKFWCASPANSKNELHVVEISCLTGRSKKKRPQAKD